MAKLTFTTTPCWDMADGFGCASLGLPGCCENDQNVVLAYEEKLKGSVLTGSYEKMLCDAQKVAKQKNKQPINNKKNFYTEQYYPFYKKNSRSYLKLALQQGIIIAEH